MGAPPAAQLHLEPRRGPTIRRPAVVIVFVAIVVILSVGVLLRPPPRTPLRSEMINIQTSDLGEGWVAGHASYAEGNRSWVEFSSVYFERRSASGGRVYIDSAVFVYRDNGTAAAVVENDTRAATGTPLDLPFNLGDGAICFAGASPLAAYSYLTLEFHLKDVVVTLYVSVEGAWEDLSGRPFTASYHLVDDTFLLARLIAARI